MVLIDTKNSGSRFEERNGERREASRQIRRHKIAQGHLRLVGQATQKTAHCPSDAAQVYLPYRKVIPAGIASGYARKHEIKCWMRGVPMHLGDCATWI